MPTFPFKELFYSDSKAVSPYNLIRSQNMCSHRMTCCQKLCLDLLAGKFREGTLILPLWLFAFRLRTTRLLKACQTFTQPLCGADVL